MTFLLFAQIVPYFQVHCECVVNIVIVNLEVQFVRIEHLVWHSHINQNAHVQIKDCQRGHQSHCRTYINLRDCFHLK